MQLQLTSWYKCKTVGVFERFARVTSANNTPLGAAFGRRHGSRLLGPCSGGHRMRNRRLWFNVIGHGSLKQRC